MYISNIRYTYNKHKNASLFKYLQKLIRVASTFDGIYDSTNWIIILFKIKKLLQESFNIYNICRLTFVKEFKILLIKNKYIFIKSVE